MGLTQLWLPILVSAVIVFIASSIIHMLPLWHKNDFPLLANQDKIMDALRPFNIPPGEYMVPRPSDMADMRTPGFQEKLNKGPVFTMIVMPNGMMKMGATMTQWFLFCCVVSVFAAYIASRTLVPGTPYLQVHRVAGCVAFVGYSLALWPQSIWYKKPWMTTAKMTVDGLIFGLLTGGTFGWLWPHA
ncbi:MAG TPA: hypothetical protein VGI83_02290 [Gemmatimonadales bacterium]